MNRLITAVITALIAGSIYASEPMVEVLENGVLMYSMSAHELPLMPRMGVKDGNAWMRITKDGMVVAEGAVKHPQYCPIPRSIMERSEETATLYQRMPKILEGPRCDVR